MASLFQRKRSPFWWVKYRNAQGVIVRCSTGFRVGNAPDARRAQALCAQKTLQELTDAPARADGSFNTWVPAFLKARYAASPITLERYQDSWRTVAMFLDERKLISPAQLTREHCFKYIEWRTKPNLKAGKYTARRNTALLDLKILGLVMNEAVIRGYCNGNPCVKLGISKDKPRIKPEYSEQDITFIRQKIQEVKDQDLRDFLSNSFEIAYYQGCRLAETRLNPQTDVDLEAQNIRFKIKGGREHVTRLHPKLLALFTTLRSQGRTETWRQPPETARQWPNIRWFRFLRDIGMKDKLPGACFHSLRVTAVTNLARKKVPENLSQRYIGHASTTVHRIYLRLKPDDLSDCTDAIA